MPEALPHHESQEDPRGDFPRLLRYLLRHRVLVATAIACSIVSAIFLGGAISLIKPLIEGLVVPAETASVHDAAERSTDVTPDWVPPWLLDAREKLDAVSNPLREWLQRDGFIRIPLAIVALYLLKGLFTFFSVYGLRAAGLYTVLDMRRELYEQAISQTDAFYRRYGTSDMLSRIMGDASRIQNILSGEIGQAVQSIPVIIICLVVAVFASWQITLLCLVAVPLFVAAAGKFGRKIKKAAGRSQERSARTTALIEETLLARRVVQAFGGLDYEQQRLRNELEKMQVQELRVARNTALTPPTMELLGALAGAGVLIYAGSLMRRNVVVGEDVLVAVLALFMMFANVRRLGQLYTAVQQTLASARRIFAVLDEPHLVRDRPYARELEPFQSCIRFENVAFHYGRGPVLDDVDLELRRGEVHALVGGSGAGKTTLSMLIPRFMDPTSGRVLIDDVDIRDVKIASLRRQIALVTQETHLFDDTVAANIAYGRPGADPEAIHRASQLAQAEQFILELPRKYETVLGERGSMLSAGQRQRIAIARAFLKDAPILILDEATSALDTESEHHVQVALERLLQGRTALIIAHRLSTVRHATRIHVLREGRIVESGSHAELLGRLGGAYARLHEMQERSRSDS